MIYVDPIAFHGWKVRGACVKSCHMWTDGEVEELDAFAVKIGLRPEWKQVSRGLRNPGIVHYDLTERMRGIAVARGAVSLSRKEAVEKWDRMTLAPVTEHWWDR